MTASLWGIDFVDDNTGWVAGEDRTVLKTSDGGENWVAQTVPPQAGYFLKDISFIDSNEGWVAGFGGTLLHTVNGGTDWEIVYRVKCCDHLTWIEFVDSQNAWAVGWGSVIDHTVDGGITWQSQTWNLPSTAWRIIKNVVATKPGATSGQQVIICGHYDSISEDPNKDAPGADDNASGTAAVLEAARVMAPYHSVFLVRRWVPLVVPPTSTV